MTDPASLAEAVGEQTNQVTRLAGAAERIPDSLERLEQSLDRYRRIYRILAIIVICFMIGIGLGVLRLNTIANGNRTIQNQNNQVLHFIKDCTDPNGTCSKKNNQQIEKAVQAIIDHLDSELDKRLPTPTP